MLLIAKKSTFIQEPINIFQLFILIRILDNMLNKTRVVDPEMAAIAFGTQGIHNIQLLIVFVAKLI
jgi:hypothetical protein